MYSVRTQNAIVHCAKKNHLNSSLCYGHLDTMVQSTQHMACIYIETTLFSTLFLKTSFPPIEHNLIPGHSHLSKLIWKRAHIERTISLWRGKINPDGLNIYIYI